MNASIWSRILEFNDKYFPKWRETAPIYYSNALAGEAGEICNGVKHMIGGGTNRISTDLAREKTILECVDVTIYRNLLLEVLGVDEESFEIWVDRKLDENRKRMASGI